jgi:dephospho-CoA kinase
MRKIILLTGLPRSGKTFVKNLLSLSPEIQTTEKEFFFFRYFDDENFDIRGNYEQNIEFLFENCKISKNLQLNRDYFIKNGNDNKDLYQNIIKNYLQVTNSKKSFF